MSSPGLSEPHLDALRNALEQVCAATSPDWSAMVGDRVTLSVADVGFGAREQVAVTMRGLTMWAGASIEQASLGMICGFSNSLAYDLVDRLLGTKPSEGTQPIDESHPSSTIAGRPLTDLERAVLEQMPQSFVGRLNECWSSVIEQTIELESTGDSSFGDVLPESVLWCRFRAKLNRQASPKMQNNGHGQTALGRGEGEGEFFLAISPVLLEPHAARLLNHFYSGCSAQQSDARNEGGSELQIVANLARSTIALEDLNDLKVGDIIATETPVDQGVEVEVESVGAFRGRPGAVHGHRAVEVYGVGVDEAVDDSASE